MIIIPQISLMITILLIYIAVCSIPFVGKSGYILMAGYVDILGMAVCKSAKARGIRIILDGVFSHTGHISRYFNADGSFEDLGAAQSKDSPYFNWYRFEDWPKKYQCWWGDESLPNVEEENPDYREYILGKNGVVRQW
ncbi:MAG: hypothetical protein IJO52_01440, partial [Clostridia bacterium]|nr:hypothetical protein [Clostridia bacterium]